MRKRLGADKLDVLDAGFVAFLDFKNQVDAIVRQFDNFGFDGNVEAAAAIIDFDDALHVRLHGRLRQSAARLGLNVRLELVVLGLFVAFKGNAVEHRVFDHGHDNTIAAMIDANVGKQAGRVKCLQALIDFLRTETATRAGTEIRAHGIDFDTPIAFDHDRANGLRHSRTARRNSRYPGTDKDTTEDQNAKGKSPNHPHTKSHALRALYPCGITATPAAIPSLPYGRSRRAPENLRPTFVSFVQRFGRTANETAGPSFPFLS